MASQERNRNENVADDVEGGSSDIEYDPGNEEYGEETFDPVCSLCDNGGTLICCEGNCMRTFHATQESAEEDFGCFSLGFTENELQALLICKQELRAKGEYSCRRAIYLPASFMLCL
ncbi:protein ENHANCED DOWNY MILDEW 2 isoform X3 [Spinacia oleracea]|uniref:Protein ENHANCED DOWNY MILDEW 2 isoform X3 n=1 Tax=Spinacia oleracea TaxID=3562 RepID=A0ABM3RNU4_SPIOL|nr:protein ENHANCED DOWNY MILDEW 2-like isoform X3 [Spinacia oleracea]